MHDRRCPSRRDVVLLGIGAFSVAALPIVARRRRELVRRSVPMMGTVAEIAVLHANLRYAHGAIDAALSRLAWVEHTMSRFRADSDVGRANRTAASAAVPVSPETMHVLQSALAWAGSSDGVFDPCLGRAVALWDVKHRHQPPPQVSIHRLAGRRLYRALDVGYHAGAPVVRFEHPDVDIDLGGIAKGYGVDCAVQVLREWGIQHGLVNVGGDLYALGLSQDGDPWSVGVRAPWDAQIVATIRVTDRAVATSGDYMQYFDYSGRRYHHLLDPATASPRTGQTHSVTVSADQCLTSDAAATTVFGLPPDRARHIVRAHAPDVRIEDLR